ncbi:hypothetical protein G6654_03065 [Polynucleobacter paneuropaeus]|nr:hypothetical protein [Polynucleobacter paneuropaeus]
MASQQVHSGRMSIRLACDTFVISQTCYRYHPKLSTDNALIADWLVRLTQNQRVIPPYLTEPKSRIS